MEVVKAFNANELHTEIIIKGTFEEPLFRASDIGAVLEMGNIRTSIADFDETEKDDVHTMDSIGRQQKVSFLTEKGLYKVLFRSRKPIAEKFQNWVCEIVKEIRLNGQYKLNDEIKELQATLESQKTELENKEKEIGAVQHQNRATNHAKFLQIFNDKKVVYVILLRMQKDEEVEAGAKKNIIKIGKTENIARRIKEISAEFMVKEPMIIDMFESNQLLKMEYQAHNHDFVKKTKCSYTTSLNKLSTECYAMTDNELKRLKIVLKEIQDTLSTENSQYQYQLEEMRLKNNETCLKIEEVRLKTIEGKLKLKAMNIAHPTVNDDDEEDDEEEEEEEEAECVFDATPPTHQNANKIPSIILKPSRSVGSNVPVVYQYTPTDLTTPIAKFNSPADLQRAKPNVALNSLRNAIKKNTIYLDYRWIYIANRTEPAPSLPPTVKSATKTRDLRPYLAQLTHDKSKIMAVFLSAKDAVEAIRKEKNKTEIKCHSFNRAIQTGGLQFGYCWNYFDNCSPDHQSAFLAHSSLPTTTIAKSLGRRIEKVCAHSGNVVESFDSKVAAAKKCGMSSKTITKILDSGEMYNGFVWNCVCGSD